MGNWIINERGVLFMEIKSVSIEVVDKSVNELVEWLINACDQFADGDLDANDFQKLAYIIRKIPSNVEIPNEIWTY